MTDTDYEAIEFSDEQITGLLKEHQAGMTASELRRKHGISDATLYQGV